MAPRVLRTGFWLAAAAVLAACSGQDSSYTPTASPTLALFQSATPNGQLTPVQTQPAVVPGASPTPFVHRVQAGDTLLGIAIRYGVELDQLLAANPEIDPRFLSIDQAIRIPGPDGAAPETILPTSTPIAVPLEPPVCYLSVTGGSICMALVENSTDETIEGLTAQISLVDARGALADTRLAYPPLNLLAPGERIPLIAYFPQQIAEDSAAHASLLSSVRAAGLEGRYAPVEINDVGTEIEPGIALVEFSVHAPGSNGEPVEVDVLAVAYDAGGQVVGFRKWEGQAPIEPGESVSGRLEVASLGPPIASIQVLAEARPAVQGDS